MNDALTLHQTVRLLGGGQQAGSLFGDAGRSFGTADETSPGTTFLESEARLAEVLAGQRRALGDVEDALAMVDAATEGIDAIRKRVSSLLQQAREAADPALTAPARAKVVDQAAALLREVDATAQRTERMGLSLLDGDLAPGNKDRHVVNDNELWQASGEVLLDVVPRLDAKALGLATMDLSSTDGARAAQDALALATVRLEQARDALATLGARLETSAARLDQAASRQEAALAKVAGREKTGMQSFRLAGAAGVLPPAGRSPGRVFDLLG